MVIDPIFFCCARVVVKNIKVSDIKSTECQSITIVPLERRDSVVRCYNCQDTHTMMINLETMFAPLGLMDNLRALIAVPTIVQATANVQLF